MTGYSGHCTFVFYGFEMLGRGIAHGSLRLKAFVKKRYAIEGHYAGEGQAQRSITLVAAEFSKRYFITFHYFRSLATLTNLMNTH